MKTNDWVRLRDVIDVLMSPELGYLRGHEILVPVTHTSSHGRCCYCVDCGHCNDDCVCAHNALLGALLELSSE